MHPNKINYLLRKAGWTQKKLADEITVSPALVSNVIHDRSTSSYVRRAISLILKLPVEEIWKPRERKQRTDMRRVLEQLERKAAEMREAA